MRLLGKGDAQASETMNDILAQVRKLDFRVLSSIEPATLGCNQHRRDEECRKLDPI